MTPQVWLGDLLRAMAAGAEPRPTAELLGLTPAAKSTEPTSPPELATPVLDRPRVPVTTPTTPAAEPAVTSSGLPRAVPMLSELSRVTTVRTGWVPGPSLALPGEDQSPEPTPLLAPRTTAAVLHTLLATPAADGAPDAEAVARLWARGEPIRTLPRKSRPTLRFGVQVLIDVGEAMELFARDQRDLVARIRAVAGIEATSIAYFAAAPTRGTGSGGLRTWRDYVPPSRGSRVLILSDFGIGGPRSHGHRATPAEWQEFVAAVRKAGCSPVGLVPYPPSRRPSWLVASMPLLLWDRSTTAGRAAVAVRR